MSLAHILLLVWIIGVVIVAVVCFFVIRSWRRKKKAAKATVIHEPVNPLEEIAAEKERLAKLVIESNEQLEAALVVGRKINRSIKESAEQQQQLLLVQEKILTKREKLKRKAETLPQYKGWWQKNKYAVLFGMFVLSMIATFVVSNIVKN
jgi:hypothetical protein